MRISVVFVSCRKDSRIVFVACLRVFVLVLQCLGASPTVHGIILFHLCHIIL